MKKFRLFVVLLLFAVCIAAIAVGCGSSSGTAIDKLPIDSNMPIQGGGNSGSGGNQGNQNNNADNGDADDDQTQPQNPPPSAETVENLVIFTTENFEYTVPYSVGDISVNEPAVPEKRGYSGKWQTYDLSLGGKITVSAEYTPIEYTVCFIADGMQSIKTYTISDSLVEAPEIPQKKGYTAVWEDFKLNYGEPITVNAVYSLIYYKIYFPVGNETLERTYTVAEQTFEEPEVPRKAGYTGKWSYGELTFGEDMFAKAVYTPVPATADKNFGWELNADKDGYIVNDYTGTDGDVVIPSAHNGLPVTEIAIYAFSNNFTFDGLKSVIIPENVQKIGNYAFSMCVRLTYAELPTTLREIGTDAFSYTGLTEIDLPEGLVKISQKAFSFSALTKVVIPDSVEEIGEYAFKNCTSLQSAVTGSGIKTISEQTFANCTALKYVEIGENVAEICKGAFDNCTSLESAVFCDLTYWYSIADNSQTASPISAEELKNTAWAAHLLKGAVETQLFKTEN